MADKYAALRTHPDRRHEKARGIPKRQYASYDKAMVRIRAGEDGQPMAAYRCPVCRLWHIGHARER